jgi:hypothetical protein
MTGQYTRHYGGMGVMQVVKDFDFKESAVIFFGDKDTDVRWQRRVCPDCETHIQEKAQENEEIADCKNLFLKDGEVVGQCCCYSKAHGANYVHG